MLWDTEKWRKVMQTSTSVAGVSVGAKTQMVEMAVLFIKPPSPHSFQMMQGTELPTKDLHSSHAPAAWDLFGPYIFALPSPPSVLCKTIGS